MAVQPNGKEQRQLGLCGGRVKQIVKETENWQRNRLRGGDGVYGDAFAVFVSNASSKKEFSFWMELLTEISIGIPPFT